MGNTISQTLSDDDMLDEIFQEIMSPCPPQDEPSSAAAPKGFEVSPLFSNVLSPTSAPSTSTSSAPSTPQLTLRRGSIPSASIGSISPNMAPALRVPTLPMTNVGTARSAVFFPLLNDPKPRINTSVGAYHAPMLFTSPTAASRRGYRRTNRSAARLQKKKPASRICRMPGCTKGIRSRGLCKAHGGGRRCTTPGCEISDQGGGHCIAHGGGRRCSITGCQKSAQSKGLCKLHGGARLCRLPDCNKNGQIKGLCRLHYSLSMNAKTAAAAKATAVAATAAALIARPLKLEAPSLRSPCDFEMRV
ncbi:hypothetical protein PHYBOEH_000958 [Phytophthora boehmeriae]|uniref:WRKY19-like zinc finger domain-containing protein n=1 Tax=Phytophthora boehmeriae TaxID=109152 RepID=A0A8T1VAZ6_9STRA|nr:hypothetical protein PHYBOEH_000958 [Phytophthora boehmeriae]